MLRALVPYLGGINAGFNALSAVCLATGYWAIRRGRRDLHRRAMLSAALASTLFLAGYLTRAAFHGTRTFAGRGPWRELYLSILFPHMVLAGAVVPLAGVTLYLSLSARFGAHRRIARWTFPIWMFVSASGIVVYLMLYRWPERLAGR